MGVNMTVTDMDTIEKSNLSRQFLFRNEHIGELKSVVAGKQTKLMNPEININVHKNKICPETETIYNEKFFKSLTCVANALDNVQARLFVDNLCVKYNVPLFESGTLGAKGNTQSIIPHLTESYGSTQDPPEDSIPMCTLKNFPYMPEHTIQWARDVFEGLFNQSINNTMKQAVDKNYIKSLPENQMEEVKNEIDEVVENIPKTIGDCINFGVKQYNKLFVKQINQLTEKYPKDMIENDIPFWSGTKRYPQVADYDCKNSLHTDFVINTALLWATIFNIPVESGNIFTYVANYISSLFGSSDKNIDNNESPYETLKNVKMNPIDFEKDDSTNHHIDFITACANMRAFNYGIQPSNTMTVKKIAGKIIPAIATTTSIVSGLVALEFVKLLQGKTKLDDFRNYYTNLAMPVFTYFEPSKCKKNKLGDGTFTMWDMFKFNNPTVQDVFTYFEDKYNVKITDIFVGKAMVYSSFLSKDKQKERRTQKILDVIKQMSKTDNITTPLSISCIGENENDEEIDLPECLIYE